MTEVVDELIPWQEANPQVLLPLGRRPAAYLPRLPQYVPGETSVWREDADVEEMKNW